MKSILFLIFLLFTLCAMPDCTLAVQASQYFYEQGMKAYLKNDFITARNSFLQALILDPRDKNTKQYLNISLKKIIKKQNTLLKKARTYRKNGFLIKSAHEYFLLLNDYPGSEFIITEINGLRIELEDTLTKSAYISPKERFSIEGFISYIKKDYNSAVISWKKALDIAPSTNNSKYLIDNRIIQSYIEASSAQVSQENRKKQTEALIYNAMEAFEKKNYHKSKKIFEEALLIDSTTVSVQDYIKKCDDEIEKAKLSREVKKVKKAEPRKENNTKNTEETEKRYQQGLVLYASGQLEAALDEFNYVLKLDPEHEKAKQAAKEIKRQLQNTQK